MAKTKTQRETNSQRDRLIEELENAKNADDRATLAKLRRGLGKEPGAPGAAERDAWVLKRLRQDASRAELEKCCLVASLFGLHPDSGGMGTLGAAFRQLWKSNDEAEGPERRFVALLDSDSEDLPMRLRQAISLLKTNDIAINWQQLLRDLRSWSHPDRYVQRQWAKDFWSNQRSDGENAGN